MDLLSVLLQSFPDLMGREARIPVAQGLLRQDAGADRHGGAVHHMDDPGIVLGRDHGALAGPGEAGGQRDHHGLLPPCRHLGEHVFKGGRTGLAGGGEHIALHQHFVEPAVIHIHTAGVGLGSKLDGHGNGSHPLCHGRDHVGSGIHDDFYTH